MLGAALVFNPEVIGRVWSDISGLASFPQKQCLLRPSPPGPMGHHFLSSSFRIPSLADPTLAPQRPFKFRSELTPPLL